MKKHIMNKTKSMKFKTMNAMSTWAINRFILVWQQIVESYWTSVLYFKVAKTTAYSVMATTMGIRLCTIFQNLEYTSHMVVLLLLNRCSQMVFRFFAKPGRDGHFSYVVNQLSVHNKISRRDLGSQKIEKLFDYIDSASKVLLYVKCTRDSEK